MVAGFQRTYESKYSVDGRQFLHLVGDNVYAFRAPKTDLYYYDFAEGERWVNWFRFFLVHTEGDLQGHPLELLEWAEACIRELFGWKCRANGARRYQTAFIWVPGKNGKTQLAMGLALGLTAIDKEPGAQVYWAAATKDQAELTCWKMITDMYNLTDEDDNPVCPDLRDIVQLHDSSMSVSHARSRSKLKIISSLPTGKHGFNVHAAILDEIHESPNQEVRNVLRAKMTTRRQPLLIYISTAGKNKKHWSHKEYEYAKKILEGEIDTESADRYMVFIREADPEADFEDREVLMQQLTLANPGIGKSVKMENMLLQWDEAQNEPAKMDMFMQCQLNIWAERFSDYLPRGAWESCFEQFSLADLKGRECYIGVDLSNSQDMTAFSVVFPYWEKVDAENEEDAWRVCYRVVPYYFTPQDAYDNSDKGKFHYRDYNKHNLEVCGQSIIKYETVSTRLKHWAKSVGRCKLMLFDPHNANEIATGIRDKEKLDIEMVNQKGWALAAATKRFSELVKTGQIKHNNNEILNWNVQNARIITKGEGDEQIERLSKITSAGKIDGLVATIMALHGAMRHTLPKPESVYSKGRGLRSV